MKLGIVLLTLFAMAIGALAAPMDNPVATYYDGAQGYPAWTDQIRWGQVIDMSRYRNGRNDFQRFENARDELAAKGGGVLYYPAGVYSFKDTPADGPHGRGLMLKRGVVIRGEAPVGKPNAFRDGRLDLPTKFVFGMQRKAGHEVPRDWNLIGLMPEPGVALHEVTNVGICWVHVVGGTVFFGPELKWGPTWKEAKGWKSAYAKKAWATRVPDGTHPGDAFLGAPGAADDGGLVGSGSNRLVFGCEFEKAAVMNDYDTCGRAEAPGGFGETGFHMAKFAARITAYGARVLVANNYLPQSDGNFLYQQTTVQTQSRPGNEFFIGKPRTSTVMWDYNRTMGVDINKDLFGVLQQPLQTEAGRGYFEPGVVVQDNWVWNHGHKGYNISGGYGTVRNNRNERIFLRGGANVYGLGTDWRLTLDGAIEASAGGGGMISDNLARAFDMAGANLWIDGNTFNNTGSAPGNDGEGILCQLHGGTPILSWAITHNAKEGLVGGNNRGFIGGWAVDCLGFFAGWNTTQWYVGTLYRSEKLADMAVIGNKCDQVLPRDNKRFDPKTVGTGTPIYESKGIPSAPVQVTATPYESDAVRIAWQDTANNEVAFRVERRIGDGPWTTVAYRPPHIEGCPQNPQDWVDFLAPTGKVLSYRVVAVNEYDTDAGASAPTPPISLVKPVVAVVAAPADNPVTPRYAEQPGAVPAWINALPWRRVVNIADYPGNTDDERFLTAQRALGGKGGVIFFPAGTYRFHDSLLLEDGVILRGEDPGTVKDAKDEKYALATKFDFPKYEYSPEGNGTPIDTAFKNIRVRDAKASNCGVVNIAINRAHVYFEEEENHNTGRNRLVFGCILTNTAGADSTVPNLDYGQLPHQRWTARHRAAIHVFSGENAFIANNRIPKSGDDNFLVKPYRLVKVQGTGQDFNIKAPKKKYDFFTIEEGVVFDYDNRPGIYVNPFSIGGFGHEKAYSTPETLPYGFRKGTIIRDNYIYNSGRSAIHFSGDGTYVGFNIIRFPAGLRRPTTTGLVISDGSATNDNRAVTARGWHWTLEGNDYEVHSNIAYDGRTKINDGEGLMHENHANSAVVGSKLLNNIGNRYLCLWVMDIDGLLIEGNRITADRAAIHVLSDGRTVRNLTIRNNVLTVGSISVTTQDGKNIVIEGNRFTGDGQSTITVTDPAWVTNNNQNFTVTEKKPKPKQ